MKIKDIQQKLLFDYYLFQNIFDILLERIEYLKTLKIVINKKKLNIDSIKKKIIVFKKDYEVCGKKIDLNLLNSLDFNQYFFIMQKESVEIQRSGLGGSMYFFLFSNFQKNFLGILQKILGNQINILFFAQYYDFFFGSNIQNIVYFYELLSGFSKQELKNFKNNFGFLFEFFKEKEINLSKIFSIKEVKGENYEKNLGYEILSLFNEKFGKGYSGKTNFIRFKENEPHYHGTLVKNYIKNYFDNACYFDKKSLIEQLSTTISVDKNNKKIYFDTYDEFQKLKQQLIEYNNKNFNTNSMIIHFVSGCDNFIGKTYLLHELYNFESYQNMFLNKNNIYSYEYFQILSNYIVLKNIIGSEYDEKVIRHNAIVIKKEIESLQKIIKDYHLGLDYLYNSNFHNDIKEIINKYLNYSTQKKIIQEIEEDLDKILIECKQIQDSLS